MMLHRTALFSLMILLVGAAGGCTQTDILSSGNVPITVAVELENIDPNSRYEFARFLISQISVRPNDPAGDAALGANPIGVIATTDDLLQVDLIDPGAFEPTSLTLATGTYRISNLEMSNFLFVDLDAPAGGPFTSCTEIRALPNAIVNFSSSNLGANAELRVQNTGEGSLTFRIDGTALVEAFENATNCTLPTGTNATLDNAAFVADVDSYLTLEQQ